MSDGLRTTYQGEGPQCPCCGRQYTADEGAYYDEQKYAEETCDECGETFDVEVHHSVNWLCTEREREETPSTLAEIATLNEEEAPHVG